MGMSGIRTVPTNIQIDHTNKVHLSRRELITGLASGAVVALAGCTENEALGRSQLILVSDAQLAQLSVSSWNQLRKQEKVSNNRTYNAQLARVGQKVAATSGLRGQQWEYVVFDSNEVNAFVLPGGKVGFYTGIMKL